MDPEMASVAMRPLAPLVQLLADEELSYALVGQAENTHSAGTVEGALRVDRSAPYGGPDNMIVSW